MKPIVQEEIKEIKEVNGKEIPKNIINKIIELRNMEVTLGHLPPESWAISDLQKRVTDPKFAFHANQIEQKTEYLFIEIVDSLNSLGYKAAEIATVINSYLKYANGPKYCNEKEVCEALEHVPQDE